MIGAGREARARRPRARHRILGKIVGHVAPSAQPACKRTQLRNHRDKLITKRLVSGNSFG
jgi:hypothetical protein